MQLSAKLYLDTYIPVACTVYVCGCMARLGGCYFEGRDFPLFTHKFPPNLQIFHSKQQIKNKEDRRILGHACIPPVSTKGLLLAKLYYGALNELFYINRKKIYSMYGLQYY